MPDEIEMALCRLSQDPYWRMDERDDPWWRRIAGRRGEAMEPGQHPTELARESGVQRETSALLLQRSMLREEFEDQGGGPRVVVELPRDGRAQVRGAGEHVVRRRLALESPAGLGVDSPFQQEGWAAVELDSIEEVPARKPTDTDTSGVPGRGWEQAALEQVGNGLSISEHGESTTPEPPPVGRYSCQGVVFAMV